MERIWIIGSSGAGKTTLAKKIGEKLSINVYHRDKISWKENWEVRSEEEQVKLVKEISDKDKWIFEGDRLSASKIDGRFDNCDTIIFLNINRFICLYRGLKRYFTHKGVVTSDHSEGCEHDYDMTTVKYVLYGYPKKKSSIKKLFNEAEKAGKTVVILNGRKKVEEWCRGL